MKRLFTVNGTHFESKVEAKKARGQFIEGKDGKPGHYEHKLTKGPDHIGNHGHSVRDTLRRGPRDAQGHRNTPPDMAKRAAKAAKK